MQKVSYMGNGSTTEFTFNFPYFENSDVVVTRNGTTATGYNIIGTPDGLDADFPYTGGKIVFDVAPTALDNITITRQLPLQRQYDFQSLNRLNPIEINRDANYLMEVIKDRKDELDELLAQYSEIADKESTETILARINAIHDEIVAIDAKITALGDITQIRGDITGLKDASNFTATGKAAIANLCMPSTKYDDLTLGVSGSTYTAPADGWLNLRKVSGNASEYIELSGRVDAILASGYSGQGLSVWIPVSKGENVEIWYNASGTTEKFRFIYANGAN